MNVTIQMHGSLRLLSEASTGTIDVSLPEHATAADALEACGAADKAYLLALDGCVVAASATLYKNCVLDVFPILEGG